MLKAIFRGQDDAGFFVNALLSGGREDLITLMPDNQPPPVEPYACMIPVLDYWRLHPGHCADHGVAHFSQSMGADILHDARGGRAVLVFDLTNEGPAFSETLFNFIHAFLDAQAVPAHRAVWLAQNRAIEAAYRNRYAKERDTLMGFEYYDFFLKKLAVSFAGEGGESLIGGNCDSFIARQYRLDTKDRAYLCLNATPRPHRVAAIAALMHRGLLPDGLISFPGFRYEKDPTTLEKILGYLAKHPGFAYLRESCIAVAELPAMTVDGFTERGNQLFDLIDPEPYRRTYFSLVTETELSDGAVARITEKTAKAFCLGHPCHVLGNPGAMTFMDELGFETFGDIMSANYERIENPQDRFEAVIGCVKCTVSMIKQDPAAWLAAVAERGASNMRHAVQGGFLREYVTRYDEPVVESLRRRVSEPP